ncbi:MAG: 2OG-Fe(II) oxygenase [Epsilonproteobacteria bacterium]|nr:2OG-Fe(II) oxygenase [Campylobacterota bacterium]
MHQISNCVYAHDDLLQWDIPTKRLPNPYHDFPYMLIKGVLTPQECRVITSFVCDAKEHHTASLRGGDVDVQVRKTDIYTLPREYISLYETRFDALRQRIESFFSLSLTRSTPLQVLGYNEGAFYLKHADDSSELRDHEGNTAGYVCVAPSRKLSTVLFANDAFEGGELLFNYLCDEQAHPIKIQPKAGDMLVFLSNPYFAHEVLPVTEGFRLSLVAWHDALI